MITDSEILRFYEYVDSLGLKFPVAAISKATGFSKGNVSQYLKKTISPSENFMNAVYEKFPISVKNVPRGSHIKTSKEKGQQSDGDSAARIDDILACNKALADAALEQAKKDVIREEKERDMVKTNLELLRMIKTASHSSEDNLLANPDVQMKLLEALAALGAGARWNTKEEALIALGNMISVPGSEEKKNVSTHAGAGKKSTVRQ